ncbi:hypothetical protein AG1IA_04793 [Rhizoctonia solani AG-1 IA]|uniref:Uncharacterized protein n=1 Tax=Thanatephorus cucumeris (strain AG1-IA) TaxID=983506 RepID=L8WXT9_THACA|nr:hypothetical protein AG1IA_04793 [Rhizoctonia solani AG-1 IA]
MGAVTNAVSLGVLPETRTIDKQLLPRQERWFLARLRFAVVRKTQVVDSPDPGMMCTDLIEGIRTVPFRGALGLRGI